MNNLAVAQWGMTFGILTGFFLVIIHSNYIMHLDLDATIFWAATYIATVILGLLTNLWFMAGQPFVLQALALFEPTSFVMEWLHDSIFGVSKDRLDEAYAAQAHASRRAADGREYVQLLVPRRQTPHPLSIGGLIHLLFFSGDDPFDPAKFVPAVARSAMALSVLSLVAVTAAAEALSGADALHARAWRLQSAGDIPAAIAAYQSALHQAPRAPIADADVTVDVTDAVISLIQPYHRCSHIADATV